MPVAFLLDHVSNPKLAKLLATAACGKSKHGYPVQRIGIHEHLDDHGKALRIVV